MYLAAPSIRWRSVITAARTTRTSTRRRGTSGRAGAADQVQSREGAVIVGRERMANAHDQAAADGAGLPEARAAEIMNGTPGRRAAPCRRRRRRRRCSGPLQGPAPRARAQERGGMPAVIATMMAGAMSRSPPVSPSHQVRQRSRRRRSRRRRGQEAGDADRGADHGAEDAAEDEQRDHVANALQGGTESATSRRRNAPTRALPVSPIVIPAWRRRESPSSSSRAARRARCPATCGICAEDDRRRPPTPVVCYPALMLESS